MGDDRNANLDDAFPSSLGLKATLISPRRAQGNHIALGSKLPIRSAPLEPSSLKGQHRKAIKSSQGKVRPFVLYSLWHTFLTRLGESGRDAWTLARIAGHSSISISARYVHFSEDAVHEAMWRLGGHSSRHIESHPQSRMALTT